MTKGYQPSVGRASESLIGRLRVRDLTLWAAEIRSGLEVLRQNVMMYQQTDAQKIINREALEGVIELAHIEWEEEGSDGKMEKINMKLEIAQARFLLGLLQIQRRRLIPPIQERPPPFYMQQGVSSPLPAPVSPRSASPFPPPVQQAPTNFLNNLEAARCSSPVAMPSRNSDLDVRSKTSTPVSINGLATPRVVIPSRGTPPRLLRFANPSRGDNSPGRRPSTSKNLRGILVRR